ncbi:MAG: hypothetical protein EOP04_13555 [Proteobacteria bacterium]|nr:MAG: hypothetical protein EOP04_13555 [Pseudomonadota bacterium]
MKEFARGRKKYLETVIAQNKTSVNEMDRKMLDLERDRVPRAELASPRLAARPRQRLVALVKDLLGVRALPACLVGEIERHDDERAWVDARRSPSLAIAIAIAIVGDVAIAIVADVA